MIPYTTPKHTFRFGFSSTLFEEARIVYEQDDEIVLEKDLSDCEKSGNCLVLVLAQEESAKFKNNTLAKVQVHYKTTEGVVSATSPRTVTVGEILKPEVL